MKVWSRLGEWASNRGLVCEMCKGYGLVSTIDTETRRVRTVLCPRCEGD